LLTSVLRLHYEPARGIENCKRNFSRAQSGNRSTLRTAQGVVNHRRAGVVRG